MYRKYFADSGLVVLEHRNTLNEHNFVVLPRRIYATSGLINFHTFHQYCILVNQRNELKEFLAKNNIGTDIYYPVPLHKQECFAHYNYNDSDFPNTNYISDHILALPIYSEISEQKIITIVNMIKNFYMG